MNGLLVASEKGARVRAARQSLSGFHGRTQKLRLMAGKGIALLAVACVLAIAAPLPGSAPDAVAADSLVGGDRPDIRTPRIAPSPNVQRPATGAGSNAAAASNCRSRCGSACQTMSCSGLVGSQCTSIRQNCRMNCASRC